MNVRKWSKDGNNTCCRVQIFDVETGLDSVLLDLNPGGWIQGVTKEKEWKMMYALDASGPNNLILAGEQH